MRRRVLLVPLLAAMALGAVGLLPSAAAAAQPCSSSSLAVWAGVEPGGGAAGSVYYRIEFTNFAASSCTLVGAPTVAAVGLHGRRIGALARVEPGQKAKPVTLANGDTATATLRIVDALNFPRGRCDPVMAAGLRVGVPGGSGAKVAPLVFRTCAATGSKTLSVAPVTAGAG